MRLWWFWLWTDSWRPFLSSSRIKTLKVAQNPRFGKVSIERCTAAYTRHSPPPKERNNKIKYTCHQRDNAMDHPIDSKCPKFYLLPSVFRSWLTLIGMQYHRFEDTTQQDNNQKKKIWFEFTYLSVALNQTFSIEFATKKNRLAEIVRLQQQTSDD